ncbi:MAG: Dolichol-phosphate mannosyltransferase [Candidatus Giovannonibacteria bacterium GW2011_GWB1_46_20]|nr:MAG: Dolichol-phosphate mannosyltransferase [Parcubacteria group bacterium GW2011_GWC1_44_10]KKT60448.1 MAG: Dolichol-phosphate mannosyltransferase [Candidatus Giovannonibacteria bacterium GW2011_GWA1_44_25]KKU30306.1 MAG: Dolichol-phosphate mannosyltransferase [Candidatus Giovannonibacteria bacterium GW2011_GWB1_46_20]
MISIVIPVYNEEKNVAILHGKIVDVMRKLNEPYEVIFVEDGSTDETLKILKSLREIKIIILAMPLGQTAALDAGIHETRGDIIITMDGDLQNDPADIPKLVAKIREGYDVVSGWRTDRHDSSGRRVLSRLANWLTAKMTGLYLHDSACALKAYRREVLAPIHLYGEMHVFLPAYLYMKGAKVAEIPVLHHAREFGISKHYFMKAVKDIFDLLTIKFMASLTGRPLIFFGGAGIVSVLLGIVVGATAIYLKLAGLRNFGQTPLPILAIFFILSGILFFMIGFLAELMLRIYFETTRKTPYTIKERIETPK